MELAVSYILLLNQYHSQKLWSYHPHGSSLFPFAITVLWVPGEMFSVVLAQSLITHHNSSTHSQEWSFLSPSKVRTAWRLNYLCPRSDLFWDQVKLIKKSVGKSGAAGRQGCSTITCKYVGFFSFQSSAVSSWCAAGGFILAWCCWTHLMNQHSLISSAVLRKQIGFLILTWVMSLGPQHPHLCHFHCRHCPYPAAWVGQGCLTLLCFTGPSTDKALDTSAHGNDKPTVR